jgi:hypothetical protein
MRVGLVGDDPDAHAVYPCPKAEFRDAGLSAVEPVDCSRQSLQRESLEIAKPVVCQALDFADELFVATWWHPARQLENAGAGVPGFVIWPERLRGASFKLTEFQGLSCFRIPAD